jgi:hypothetical protein
MRSLIIAVLLTVVSCACCAQSNAPLALRYVGRTNSTPNGPIDSVVFCLTNSTPTDLLLGCANTDMHALGALEMSGSPMFVREQKIDGKWVPLEAGKRWCSACLIVPAGFTLTFVVPAPPKARVWRVSVGNPPIFSKEVGE